MYPFQVTVLSDQVESQTEKITDLERVLDDKQGTLQKTEDVLARELLEKSALETARLGLLSEITDMRLRQVNQFSDDGSYMNLGRLRQNERTRNLGGGFKSPYTCRMPVWRGKEAPASICNNSFFSAEERVRHLLQECFDLSGPLSQLQERALRQGGKANDL